MMRILRELFPKKLRDRLHTASLIRNAKKNDEIFYCQALAGESDFNICINSDMTVSCNCQDFDGSGHIGDLTTQTLAEVFSGPIAHRFRTALAARSFPSSTCIHCAERKLIAASEVDRALFRYSVPRRGIMVENTAHCNLRCHLCDREKLLVLRDGKTSLLLTNVEKIALLLRENCIESLYYFNLGEPFLPPDILEQITIIRNHNPHLRIIASTNGQLLDRSGKREAALLMDYISVSLDGINQEIVSKYQVGAQFEKAYQNMSLLVSERNARGAKTIIEWKYVVFRWNDHPDQINEAIRLAQEIGVDAIGFYRGEGRLSDRSLRWHFHPLFKKTGENISGGKIVNLNNIPAHLLSP